MSGMVPSNGTTAPQSALVYQWRDGAGLSAYVALHYHRLIVFVYVSDVLV